MNYELPTFMRMSKKEEQETSKKLNTIARGMAKNFLRGLFFFITVPISIYNKMKKYTIIDEEGYTWCVDKGIATDKYGNTIRNFGYWGHKRFEAYEGDFNKRAKRMNYLHALSLFLMMKLSGIKGNSILNSIELEGGKNGDKNT